MSFCSLLNPLIILFYILTMFLISTDCSWEEFMFDKDEDNYSAWDYSELFITEDTAASFRPSDSAGPIESIRPSDSAGPIESTRPLSKNSTLEEMKDAFWELYQKSPYWALAYCGEKVLQDTCYAALKFSPSTHQCAGERYDHTRKKSVELKEGKSIQVDLVQCRCTRHNATKQEYRLAPFRYLAGYNESAVFILDRYRIKSSFKLKITALEVLNDP